MKIAIASDHRGYGIKQRIIELLTELGHQSEDMGTDSTQSCDYPEIALPAAQAVATGQADRAILICGSGVGMSIVGNKVPGVRAALCHDELTARMCRKHNNANALCLASDVTGEEPIFRIINTWLATPFDGGARHERRVEMIGKIDGTVDGE